MVRREIQTWILKILKERLWDEHVICGGKSCVMDWAWNLSLRPQAWLEHTSFNLRYLSSPGGRPLVLDSKAGLSYSRLSAFADFQPKVARGGPEAKCTAMKSSFEMFTTNIASQWCLRDLLQISGRIFSVSCELHLASQGYDCFGAIALIFLGYRR